MLQRVQAEGDEGRRVLDADDAEDAALLAQLVVVEGGWHAVRAPRGVALRRYIEARSGQCHQRLVGVAAATLRQAVVLAGDPLRGVLGEHGLDALLEVAEDGGAAALVDLLDAAGAAEDGLVDDERDHDEQDAAGDAEEEAEALVDGADGGVLHRAGEERRDEGDEDERHDEGGGEAGEDAELAVGAEEVAQDRDLAHQGLEHRGEVEAGEGGDDPAGDRERLAHEAAGVGEDGGEGDDGQDDAVDECEAGHVPLRYRSMVPKHLSMNAARSATG